MVVWDPHNLPGHGNRSQHIDPPAQEKRETDLFLFRNEIKGLPVDPMMHDPRPKILSTAKLTVAATTYQASAPDLQRSPGNPCFHIRNIHVSAENKARSLSYSKQSSGFAWLWKKITQCFQGLPAIALFRPVPRSSRRPKNWVVFHQQWALRIASKPSPTRWTHWVLASSKEVGHSW